MGKYVNNHLIKDRNCECRSDSDGAYKPFRNYAENYVIILSLTQWQVKQNCYF